MDLIDKNALIDKCLGWNGNVVTCDAGADFCDRHATCIECIIDTMPLIDAVPVVRCKDCIYSKQNDGRLVEGARYCTITFSGTLNELTSVWDVDYCSNGERKDLSLKKTSDKEEVQE